LQRRRIEIDMNKFSSQPLVGPASTAATSAASATGGGGPAAAADTEFD
jgi:hypothetical protein